MVISLGITHKECYNCKCTKLMSEFNKNSSKKDGLCVWCRSCSSEGNKKHHKQTYETNCKNPEWIEKRRSYPVSHVPTKEYSRKAAAKYRLINRDKVKARLLTDYEIRAGRITRMPCEVCGDNITEAHHDDYSKPLDIRWLCKKHHAEHHRKHKT